MHGKLLAKEEFSRTLLGSGTLISKDTRRLAHERVYAVLGEPLFLSSFLRKVMS